MTDPTRWTVRLYDKDGTIKSEADFATKQEADACRDDLEQMVAMGGGRLEVEGPEGER